MVEGGIPRLKGIAIDVDQAGTTAVVVPAAAVDDVFIQFVQSEEYLDWLEEAHSGEVDFPYTEPIMINGKEYDLPVFRIQKQSFCPIGGEVEYSQELILAELKN